MRNFDELKMKKFNPQIKFFICSMICIMSCGTKTGNFKSLDGRLLNLHEDSVNVLIFLNTECPVCQKYQGAFRPMVSRHPEVSFAFVFCGVQNEKEVRAFCDYDSIPPAMIFTDRHYTMARRFKASVTPQVIVLKGDKEVYSGRIDDRFRNLGASGRTPGINYVENALFSLSGNEEIQIRHTEAVGCFIEPR